METETDNRITECFDVTNSFPQEDYKLLTVLAKYGGGLGYVYELKEKGFTITPEMLKRLEQQDFIQTFEKPAFENTAILLEERAKVFLNWLSNIVNGA